jgi:hypothetical protein
MHTLSAYPVNSLQKQDSAWYQQEVCGFLTASFTTALQVLVH